MIVAHMYGLCANGFESHQNYNKFAITGRLIVILEFFIVNPILSDLAIFHCEPYSVRLDNFV